VSGAGSRVAAGAGAGLLASAVLIGVLTAVARVAGFGRNLVFSANVGAQCVGSAYATANQLPNVLFEVVAGGALAGAVVPLLAGPLAAGARAEIDRIASALIGWILLVLVPAAVLLAALSTPLSKALIEERCAGQQALTARMLIVFAPQIVLYGLGVVLSGVLVAHRRFLAPALAPLLSSLVVIGAYRMFGLTADAAQNDATALPGAAEAWLAWGTTAGVVVMTVPLLVPVSRLGVRLRPTLTFPAGVARRGLALAGAGIGALVAQQASVVVVLLLSNRRGGNGAIAVFQYVQAVYLLPYAVLAVPLATSAFPRLAERAAAGDRAGFARTSAVSTRVVAVVSLLGTAGLVAAAPAVAQVFTALDPGDLSTMGPALTGMAPGLLGFGLIAHLARALYALERGRDAAVATVTGWLVVIAASFVAVRLASVVPALAWANTVGMTVAGGLLVLALRRVAGPGAIAGLARVVAAASLAAAAAAGAGRVTGDRLLDSAGSGLPAAVVAGAGAGLVCVAVFAAGLALLDRPDLALLLKRGPALPPSDEGSR
jgi:putative peptidoglycan lipid II flippase